MTFRDYLLRINSYSESSLFLKEKQLQQWQNLCLGGRRLEQARTQDILRMIEALAQRYTAPTLNNMICTLEQYFYFLIETGRIKRHPLKNFRIKTAKSPIIKSFFTEEELHRIYEEYPVRGHYSGQFDIYKHRNKVILGMMVYQGLDSGSLRQLKLQDVYLDKGRIHISETSAYKLEERTLELEACQMMELLHYINHTRAELLKLVKVRPDTPLLFPVGTNTQFCKITSNIRKQVGLENILQLRYSRINLWKKRYNLRETQYKAGYKSLLSLEKFNQGELESLKQAIDKYHPF